MVGNGDIDPSNPEYLVQGVYASAGVDLKTSRYILILVMSYHTCITRMVNSKETTKAAMGENVTCKFIKATLFFFTRMWVL